MSTRPVAAITEDATTAAAEVALAFAARLEHALDVGDAAGFDDGFAADVLWGSPFGAVIEGHDAIAAIHAGMIHPPPADGPTGGGSLRGGPRPPRRRRRGAGVRAPPPAGRPARARRTMPRRGPAADFDEIALFVLVRREGGWWLAAGQHVPDRRVEVYGDAV